MKYIFGILVLSSLLSQCIGIPDFDKVPQITFKSITKTFAFNDAGSVFADSLTFVVDYQDGDGDLGLSNDEINKAPFTGEYANNYIVSGFRKVKGNFVAFSVADNSRFTGSFPKLNETGKSRPIKGVITYGFFLRLPSPETVYKAGDTLKFDIYIYDRSLNKSNSITTSEVVLSK